MSFKHEIRLYLYELRAAKNYSMHEMARKLDMPPELYCRFENGIRGFNRDIRFYFKLAKVLEVDAYALFKKEAEYRNSIDDLNNVESPYRYISID